MKKELRKLSVEERVGVSICCDSFFISTNKTKVSLGIYNVLREELSLHKRFNTEINMFVTMVGKALSSGCEGSQVPLQTESYKLVNKTRDNKLNRDRVKVVMARLEELGYLDIFMGYRDLVQNVSLTTCVIFHDKLVKLYPSVPKNVFGSNVTKTDVVEVKDSSTKEPIIKLTKFKGINQRRDFMMKYNILLQSNDIRFKGRKCFVQYKQIFADDLEGAGRIYSFGSFQTMPSYLRKTLSINGFSCTEVDLRANHISIMYLLSGITLTEDFDCYGITLNGYEYTDIRNLCKMGVMCLINCKSKVAACHALMKVVRKDHESENSYLNMFPYADEFKEVFYMYVINTLIKLHYRLKFFTRKEVLWKKLQRLDSRISEGVIKHFTDKQEVVLSWHDSWLIRKGLQKELIDVIRDSWYKVFGTYNNCFLKIEF